MAATKKNIQKISSDHGLKNPNTDAPTSPTPVTPGFILSYEVGEINGYYLGMKIAEVTGLTNVVSVQQIKNLWIIYFADNVSKVKATSQGISIDGLHVKVHNTNPFMTKSVENILSGGAYENKEWIKILIKDLRHSVSSEDIVHMFTKVFKMEGITASMIKYAHYRDDNGKLTSLLNGDRFLWIDPDILKKPLPRFAQCGVWRCRLFHRNQFPNANRECYRCFGLDHMGKDCTNPWCCRVCKEPGHKPGSMDCPHYHANFNLRPFGGEGDPMSNHYKCEFEYNHVPSITSENHWFHQKSLKNGQEELSNMCLHTEDGKHAQFLSNSIMCTENWDDSQQCYELMKDIARAKFQQVKKARDELYVCWFYMLKMASMLNFCQIA